MDSIDLALIAALSNGSGGGGGTSDVPSGSVAPTFSTSTPYSAGDYVWYSDTLYRFTADHAAGAWTGTDAVQASIGADISGLKSAVSASLSDSESSMTVTRNYPKGSLVTVNGALYKTTAAVASGQTLVPGTNCVLTSISDELKRKANTDGNYPDMTVGNAEQLVATVGVEDKVPYNFRTSGGSADIGDREEDMVIGGTVAWNQMVQISSIPATKTVKGVTFTNNGDGSVTINGTAESQISGTDYVIIVSSSGPISGHKYLSFGCPSGGSQSTYYVYDGYVANGIDTGNGHIGGRNLLRLYYLINEGVTIDNAKVWPQFFDLTRMFGSTIADYIYALEQNHAGDGVAWFRKLFPKAYYAYDAGTLMSVKTSAHRMTGFNAWDGTLQAGSLSTSTGAEIDVANTKRSDYIDVIGGATYYFRRVLSTCNSGNFMFYDASKNYLSYISHRRNQTFNVPSNARYMRFTYDNFSFVANDICINLAWDNSRNGEYEPYELHSYALDSDLELRGIPKLDADNKLYYDGDTYEADGTVTRRYGILDLGTLSWAKNSSAPQFYAAPPTPGVQDRDGKNVMCTAYAGGQAYNAVDKTVCLYGNFIWIADTSIESQTAFNNAMDGVYLVYELATSTTESADPFTSPQIVNDFGTEEYVDSRDVPIPVGHDTVYQANLRAKLEMAPDSPDGDGDYIVRQSSGQNAYVPLVLPLDELPAAPDTDGTYVLKVTVASGEATYSWVSE